MKSSLEKKEEMREQCEYYQGQIVQLSEETKEIERECRENEKLLKDILLVQKQEMQNIRTMLQLCMEYLQKIYSRKMKVVEQSEFEYSCEICRGTLRDSLIKPCNHLSELCFSCMKMNKIFQRFCMVCSKRIEQIV